jgi:hypothetical protein
LGAPVRTQLENEIMSALATQHQHHHYPRSIIDITRDGGRPGQRIAGRPLTVGPLVRVGDREGPADAALGTKRIQVRPVPGRFSATRE